MAAVPKTATYQSATNISNAAPSLLRTLFLHHDGIIVGATIAALHRHGVLDTLLNEQQLSMRELLKIHPSNSGYLHVALRCLALQGWVKRHGPIASDDMVFELTASGKKASSFFDLYSEAADFVYAGIPMEEHLFESDELDKDFSNLVSRCIANWGFEIEPSKTKADNQHEIIARHLDGLLAGPIMIAAKNRDLLSLSRIPLKYLQNSSQNLLLALDLLEHFGWFSQKDKRWVLTDLGKFAAGFSLHYGLTLSYWPMLCNLQSLIFNSSKNITHVQPGKEEIHVDRTLNVLASGVAHRRYFEDSDKIIIEIFNQEPLSKQPKFVADMGCGDGAWLQRIYLIVSTKTLRGEHLKEYPLLMVGADYNVKAQQVADDLLNKADIPHLVLFGDITDPKQFADELQTHNIDIHDGLHVRAFIDHNRRYTCPVDQQSARARTSLSSGAYADENGQPIANYLLEQNLVEHFRKWVPFLHRHGLIVIEAHNVEPTIAALHNGKTHATAFDTYHGYSNQYPLDFEAFMQLAEEAGLRSISYQQSLYPSKLPFVAISINRFKASLKTAIGELHSVVERDKDEWQPDGSEDIGDGEALHRFLYEGGDITRPRRWCFRPTGILVETVLKTIERRIFQIKTGVAENRSIVIVDYGAGTGLATLELIKGLNEKGLIKQIEKHQISFKLVLFDFPSGWFAKGFQLLSGFPFVKFFSLQDQSSGKVRLISDILSDETVDILIASMVLHLVPPKVLPILSDSFESVLKHDGILIWNTPDTTPTMTNSEVIHASNRALRKTFLDCLDDKSRFDEILARVPEEKRHEYTELTGALNMIKQHRDAKSAQFAQIRADKQILPSPTDLSIIEQALKKNLCGSSSNLISLFSKQDLLDLALLPANQRYLNEIENVEIRVKFIKLLLSYDVIPKFCAGPAGQPKGVNLHWIFGQYQKAEAFN